MFDDRTLPSSLFSLPDRSVSNTLTDHRSAVVLASLTRLNKYHSHLCRRPSHVFPAPSPTTPLRAHSVTPIMTSGTSTAMHSLSMSECGGVVCAFWKGKAYVLNAPVQGLFTIQQFVHKWSGETNCPLTNIVYTPCY